MKQFLIILAVATCLVQPARADQSAVEQVIQNQMNAFMEDDFTEAFKYASPMIRSIFGTPERFGDMVRNGYPMVWRPSDVRFFDSVERDGGVVQTVMVRDASGALHLLEYRMLQVEPGVWKINGVRLLDDTAGAA